ncbi:MAG: transcriptional regulator, partial [Gammaproteobacteria bacterium]|nr:transcriptional regulator [Gammaproteobacteria bacterium]
PKEYPKGYPSSPETIGEKIRKHRMDLGLFQKDIPRIIGVVTDTVTNWEKCRTKPCRKNLHKIVQFLENY